jgi:hypothetical protein
MKWSKIKLRFPCPGKKAYRGSRVQLHSVLTLALDGGEWLTSCPGCFTPRMEPQYPPNTTLGGPQSRSGRFGEEENLLLLPTFKRQATQYTA